MQLRANRKGATSEDGRTEIDICLSILFLEPVEGLYLFFGRDTHHRPTNREPRTTHTLKIATSSSLLHKIRHIVAQIELSDRRGDVFACLDGATVVKNLTSSKRGEETRKDSTSQAGRKGARLEEGTKGAATK